MANKKWKKSSTFPISKEVGKFLDGQDDIFAY